MQDLSFFQRAWACHPGIWLHLNIWDHLGTAVIVAEINNGTVTAFTWRLWSAMPTWGILVSNICNGWASAHEIETAKGGKCSCQTTEDLGFTGSKMHRCFELLSSSLGTNPWSCQWQPLRRIAAEGWVTGPGRFQEGNVSPNLDRYRTRFRHVFEMLRCCWFQLQHVARLNSAGKRKGASKQNWHVSVE